MTTVVSQVSFLVPSNPRRVLAFLLDETGRFLFMAPLWGLAFLSQFLEAPDSYRVGLFFGGALLFWLFRACCLYYVGATVGKYLCGLELQGRTGGRLDFSQSLIRILADDLGIFLLGLPRAVMFFRLDRTQFSDWVAETRVVQRRGGVLPLHRSSGLGVTLILLSLFILL